MIKERKLKWRSEKTRKLALHEELSHAKAKLHWRERYSTSNDSAVIFKRLFYLIFARLNCEGKCNFQITVDKIKNVSLCPCLLTTEVASTDREKKIKYASSHLPGFMFIFAMSFLNEPFIPLRSIFTIFTAESFSLNSTIKENIDYSWSPRHSRFLRHHLPESFPVLGSFAVQVGDHLRYWDHLRALTVLENTPAEEEMSIAHRFNRGSHA